MKIIIHRGAAEQGGTCIELVSGTSRILLDYGVPPPVAEASAEPNAEAAALNIPGLYDKSQHPIQAILLSHTHFPHYGALLAKPINPGIKVFMTEIMEDVTRIIAKMPREYKKLSNNVHYYRKGHKFIIGRFVITPYLMDHTAAEAFAFLIESDGKRLIYTGDFRAHGNKAAAFKQLLAADMGRMDALITDGTNAAIEKGPGEQEVMEHLEPMLKARRGPIYFMCAGQDVALLTGIATLAKNTRRFFVVDGYTTLLLERLKALALKQGVELKIPGLDTEYLRIVRNSATQRIYQLSEYAETFRRMRPKMFGWDWVRENLDRLVIPVRANSQLWIDEQIKDLRGGTFIYSEWENYTEEDGLRETLAWFRSKKLAEIPLPSAGHAYFSTIRKLVENKKPRYIIPINAPDREKFTDTFGKRARLLNNAEEFTLD